MTASIGGLDDARLRRAQALLPNTEHRLTIARELLEAKIKGQLAVLDSFGLYGTGSVRQALALLDRADRIDHLLIAEGKAAEAYWSAWGMYRWSLRGAITSQITGARLGCADRR